MAAKVGQLTVDMLLNTAKFEKEINQAARKFDQMGRKLSQAGKALTTGVTLPIVAAAAAIGKLANDFDKGLATIRVGTGATGKALDDLGNSMKAVLKTVPNSIDQVSIAIADLNTRLGLTGQPLEQMARQMLNVSRITKTDISSTIAGATRVFGQFSIATEKQSATLDLLFKASQQSGIGFTKLMTNLTNYGAQLKSFGFDIKQSTALLALWEKAGINAEGALSGLSMGLGKFAKAGVAPADAIRRLQAAMDAAGDETKAMSLAIEAFGTRSGAVLGRAMIEGKLNIDEFAKALDASSDSINQAAEDSITFGESMGIMRNKILLAAEPLGKSLLNAFEKLMPYIEKAFDFIAKMAEGFSKLPTLVQASVLALTAMTAAIGPLTWVIGGTISGFGSLLKIMPMLTKGLKACSLSMATMGKVGIAVGAFWVGWKLGELLNKLEWVRKAGDAVASAIMKIPGVAPDVKGALSSLEIQTQRLADRLSEMGVSVERLANESIEDWADRVKAVAAEQGKLQGVTANTKVVIDDTIPTIEGIDAALDSAGGSMDFLSGSTKKTKDAFQQLREDTQKALNPFGELQEKITSLINDGFDKDEVIRLFSNEIKNAAHAQIALHGHLEKSHQKLVNLANGFSLVTDEMQYLGKELTRFKHKIETDALEPISNWEDAVIDVDSEIWDVIGTTGKDWPQANKKAGTSMNDLGQQVSTVLTNMTQDLNAKVKSWAGPFGDFAAAALASLEEGLFGPFMNWLTKIGNAVGNWLSDLFGKFVLPDIFGGGGGLPIPSIPVGGGPRISGPTGGGGGSLFDFLNPLSTLTNIFSNFTNIFGSLFSDEGKDRDEIEQNTRYTSIAAMDIGQSVKNIVPTLDLVNGQLSEMKWALWSIDASLKNIPSFQTGITSIPQNMLAFLHKGEAVIPQKIGRLMPELYKTPEGMATLRTYMDQYARPLGQKMISPQQINYRGGENNIIFNISGGNDIVQTIKTKVIPILRQEMVGGNTGLREAVRMAYDRTARAF